MSEDNKTSGGSHHFGFYFAFGFLAGALVGLYFGSNWLDGAVRVGSISIICGLAFGLISGQYGESAWHTLSDWLRLWW
jgi:hypothetical protein